MKGFLHRKKKNNIYELQYIRVYPETVYFEVRILYMVHVHSTTGMGSYLGQNHRVHYRVYSPACVTGAYGCLPD